MEEENNKDFKTQSLNEDQITANSDVDKAHNISTHSSPVTEESSREKSARRSLEDFLISNQEDDPPTGPVSKRIRRQSSFSCGRRRSQITSLPKDLTDNNMTQEEAEEKVKTKKEEDNCKTDTTQSSEESNIETNKGIEKLQRYLKRLEKESHDWDEVIKDIKQKKDEAKLAYDNLKACDIKEITVTLTKQQQAILNDRPDYQHIIKKLNNAYIDIHSHVENFSHQLTKKEYFLTAVKDINRAHAKKLAKELSNGDPRLLIEEFIKSNKS